MARRRSSPWLLALVALAAIATLAWWWRGAGEDGPSSPAATPTPGGEVTSTRGTEALAKAGARAVDDPRFADQYAAGGGGLITVDGRVIDGMTRAPVAGVDVLFSLPIGAEETVTSGGDGQFSIQLGPGGYEVRAVGELLYAPARPLKVGRVGAPLRLDVEVTRLARVRGRVVDDGGAGVVGATVAVAPAREASGAYDTDAVLETSVTSGADGAFELTVFPGEVRLAADAPGGYGRVTVPGVPPAAVHDGVEIRLQAHAGVAGVVRGPDGAVVAGAVVHATVRVAEMKVSEQLTRESDAGGRFRFDRIKPASLTLEARAAGFAASAPVTMSPAPGEQRDGVVLALGEPLELAGRVVDAAGAPVADAKVELERPGSRAGRPPVRTGADGTFRFVDLDAGPFALVARAPGYARARRDQVAAPAEGVELTLQSPGRIRGVVTDAAGRPVRDFTVSVELFVPVGGQSSARAPGPTRFAAEDGRYELGPVEPGRYDLVIAADGHAPATRLGVEVPPEQAGDGSAQLGVAGSIAGVVRCGGEAVPGARVSVMSGHAGTPAYTDDQGRFAVTGIAPGVRTVAVSRAGCTPARIGGVKVTQGETPLEVELEPADDAAGGTMYGIGVVLQQGVDGPRIARILKRTPAAAAQLRVGDRIRAVDGTATVGMAVRDVLDLLRGAGPSAVVLEVDAAGGEPRTIVLHRARIRFDGDDGPVARNTRRPFAPTEPLDPGHRNHELSGSRPRSTIEA